MFPALAGLKARHLAGPFCERAKPLTHTALIVAPAAWLEHVDAGVVHDS